MNRGFYTIMGAQFLSSLADNALLIAAIALLTSLQAPDWMTPLLKLFFVVSYVCLAAWVGIFADSMPKGRVMFITNFLKCCGCLLMLFGSHPLLAYAVVGVGAAAYSPAKYGILTELLPPGKLDPVDSIKNFTESCKLLWTDRLGQISLAVTTLFWGAGAVLQFLVLKWCEVALGMNLSEGAVMQAVVSLGIALGAFLAAAKIPLKRSLSVLPMGICMGLLVTCTAYFSRDVAPAGGISMFGGELSWAAIIAGIVMVLVGICAGLFVVPMNALLQHRGHVLMSAGRSIAVQNFNENLSILVMLGLYALLIRLDLSVQATMVTFGVFVMTSMLLVILKHRRNQAEYDSTHLIGEAKRH